MCLNIEHFHSIESSKPQLKQKVSTFETGEKKITK